MEIGFKVVGVILVLSLVGFWAYAQGEQKEHNRFFEYWSADCRREGGTIQLTGTNSAECFKDGNIILHVD